MNANRYERLKARLIEANENTSLKVDKQDSLHYGRSFDRLKSRLTELGNISAQRGSQKQIEPKQIEEESSRVPAASWSTPIAILPSSTFSEKEYPHLKKDATISTNVSPNFSNLHETGVPAMSKSYADLSNPSTFEESQALDLEDSLLDSVYASSVSKNEYNIEDNITNASASLDFESLDALPMPSPEVAFVRKPQLSMNHLAEPKPMYDTEYTNNVKTLINLVNNLPEGVTKQTGAQIIRLTMEAMGIAMEEVLSEAQSAQSEMLEAVRGNIKKIEEYKTVIRKLETDIKHYQGKANELSEIIDLFILSSSKISE